jgi:SAM-dependent methyltransferase
VTEAERDKWNERYRSGSYVAREHPTALLAQWAPRLPIGKALDVACGAGRNALFLAAAGHTVDAVDISDVAIERARGLAADRRLQVHFFAADLDGDPNAVLPATSYDLIVWVRYVNTLLMPCLLERLAAGGHLLCEQHLITTAEVVGPNSEEFRLQPNELRHSAGNLDVLHYSERLRADPDGRPAALAQLVARRTA